MDKDFILAGVRCVLFGEFEESDRAFEGYLKYNWHSISSKPNLGKIESSIKVFTRTRVAHQMNSLTRFVRFHILQSDFDTPVEYIIAL